jgi:hypothetical protein
MFYSLFLIKNILYIRMLFRISSLTYMGHYVLAVTFYELHYSSFVSMVWR